MFITFHISVKVESPESKTAGISSLRWNSH